MLEQLNFGICCANKIGLELLSFIISHDYKISFVVTHINDFPEYEERISEICAKKNIPLLRKTDVNSQSFIELVKELNLDLMLLTWWPTIINPSAINAPKIGWVNLHPSLLPYSRGKHPYYWSLVENTPFGVSIHLIDEGIDTGPILFQKEIEIMPSDTGETLYERASITIVELFKDSFTKLIKGDFIAIPQDEKHSTFHFGKELEKHSEIIMDEKYLAKDLINILRGRTFKNGSNSSYFIENGKRYNIKISISTSEH